MHGKLLLRCAALIAFLPVFSVSIARASWPVLLGDEIHSSPVVADLEPDGTPDIVIFSTDGKLHVLTPDGTEHAGPWPLQLGPPSSIADGQNWVSGSAALVDLDRDGDLEILQATFDGKLHALSALGVEAPGFPVTMGTYSTDTPTVADLDGDGDPEIVCRYNPNAVGLWSHTGVMQPGWPQTMANAPGGAIDVWSSAAFGDLDGDGELEVVMGGYEGYGHAFHHTGAIVAGWPVNLNPSGGFPGWVLSSPACADFDQDGRDEVVIGCDDDKLYLLRGDGTSFIPGTWPKNLPFGFRASPALADLDGDDDLEIVIGHRSNAGDLRLYAIHHTGAIVNGWPVIQAGGAGGYTFGWLSPLLADLTGDGRPEVIAVKERRVANPGQAEIHVFGPDGGSPLPGFPIPLQGLAYGAPVVCDLDGDGLAEVLIGDLTRRLYRFDLALSFDPARDRIEWTRFQKDLGNTGRFPGPSLNAVDDEAARPARVGRAIAAPNPFVDSVRLAPAAVVGGASSSAVPGSWRIFDLRGGLVRVLESEEGTAVWYGDREDGAPAPSGLYYARCGGMGASVTVLRLRPTRLCRAHP